ncbi:DUF4835 family protein [Marixanthomonas sp. SCSIO 43207]|uniref:type IX secretion system protein PorD n=1 Tax=Marixanthomonas sp. SCSIO 43207 TaxID=2779360 RepID=UPI001CA7CF6F|nr:DUF4835 family protein [Marixanthomonas sp. SCSIO 43207]UAB81165.1 DUF4835 family protein [Marixanthomonas sp. SCSIO 43207]
MRKFILLLFVLTLTLSTQAQELNCSITVDAEQTGQPNLQVFRTLQQELTDFVNNTKWTNKVYKNQERIDCNMSIIISDFESTSFSATIQVQASRPTFNSTYDSPIYNYNDRQFSFDYTEFQPLNFNLNTFNSNLISVIAYHVYTIIGLDADTFEKNGGEEYFQVAKQIINTAASSNFIGWKPTDGTQTRYRFNEALLSNVYQEFHTAMYEYHREGLDIMTQDPKDAKEAIVDAIQTLSQINNRRPNSYIIRTFFDAKSDEIQSIFSGGPSVDIVKLVENLNKMAPTKRSNWSEIKF